ncbi:Dabb family protein [Bradyrhizobium iriomotense]|uniref:Stress responsive protein n=1 Tax=Bradyrhizobium iriomotense TaxID=441950 RepID=A0ABQ6AUK5_9BRAD|nr:Dabb family protein [Bradyrhizobium iriomotense]GLR85889.1 stress responsive protein [Bradyrhizobium iriomotense]
MNLSGGTERVKHIVMWNLVGSSEEEKAASVTAVKSRFERLLGVIPGMTHLEIGVDFSRVNYACDIVLYSEFESREALAAYATHPAHLKVRDELEGVRIARHQVDYVSR